MEGGGRGVRVGMVPPNGAEIGVQLLQQPHQALAHAHHVHKECTRVQVGLLGCGIVMVVWPFKFACMHDRMCTHFCGIPVH